MTNQEILEKAVHGVSLEAIVIIKMPSDEGYLSLFDIRQLLLSGRYRLEVALPHDGSKDRLTLIFTEDTGDDKR